jgi:hypothetical protein
VGDGNGREGGRQKPRVNRGARGKRGVVGEKRGVAGENKAFIGASHRISANAYALRALEQKVQGSERIMRQVFQKVQVHREDHVMHDEPGEALILAGTAERHPAPLLHARIRMSICLCVFLFLSVFPMTATACRLAHGCTRECAFDDIHAHAKTSARTCRHMCSPSKKKITHL